MSAPEHATIPPEIVEQTIQWMMRLAETPDPALQSACKQWRNADARHELAWQRLQGIHQRLNLAVGATDSAPLAGDTILRYCQQHTRRQTIKWLFGGVAIGSLGLLGLSDQLIADGTNYHTAKGELRSLQLADGTELTLNTQSSVQLHYNEQERRVRLQQGEILISTAQDLTTRPFYVDTPNGLLTALGTRFSVRQHSTHLHSTHVAVFDGAVRVEPRANPHTKTVVSAGQQLSFDPYSWAELAALDTNMPSWTQGMLVAERMRLDHFLVELNRYRSGMLGCDDGIAHLTVTGAFRVDDTDKALAVLATVLNLKIRYRTRYWVHVESA